jgi:hypothetical protein
MLAMSIRRARARVNLLIVGASNNGSSRKVWDAVRLTMWRSIAAATPAGHVR